MMLETAVKEAQSGNKEALERVIIEIQDKIYYLALRMLANPQDAQDATQEIIIRIITKLSTFQFESAFTTWVYRVATNALLDTKRGQSHDPVLSFDDYRHDLEADLADPADLTELVEYPLLLNEVRISCTMAMLLCLNKPHRLAYILGEIFQMDHSEASDILGITPANYRKQLSRARSKVLAFTQASCGLVASTAKCHCSTKMRGAIQRERININNIQFARPMDASFSEIEEKIGETQAALRGMALQTAVPHYKSSENFGLMIEQLINSEKMRRDTQQETGYDHLNPN